mmetsp:Transcript_237/g.441  ORF Transcript_237/g.441 Transcript_237/m.441 type:complete len:439 (-) Transcript_237:502-1818(-)
MQLAAPGNNMFTSFSGLASNHGVGLGKFLQALHKLRKVRRVLHRHRHAHDRGYSELHRLDAARSLAVGDGTRLDQELVDANQTTGVTGRNVSHGFGVASHHDYHALNGLVEEIGFLARYVVGAQDAHLLTSANLTRKHTSERSETVVGTRNHLGHIHHERSTFTGVARADGGTGFVVERAVVQRLGTVLLSSDRRREVYNDHLKNCLGGWEPLLHDMLEQRLARQGLLNFLGEVHTYGGRHIVCLWYALLVQFVVHHSLEHVDNGVHDESDKRTLGARVSVNTAVGVDGERVNPLALAIRGSEYPITPQLLNHLVLRGVELSGIHLGESLQGEPPLVQTGAKGNITFPRNHLPVAVTESVGFNNHIHVLDSARHVLVNLFTIELQLKESAIDLVDHEYRSHAFRHGLSQNGTGLYSHTFNAIDNHEGTVGYAKSSSYF